MCVDAHAKSKEECAVQKDAEKCQNTHNGQAKKPPGRTTAVLPRKNLHTAISVNTPKLSVTKHDQH